MEEVGSYLPLIQEANTRTDYNTMDKRSRTRQDKSKMEKKEKNLGKRLELRKKLMMRRRWLIDLKFVTAMAGLFLMVTENEIFYQNADFKGTLVSVMLKAMTSITTIVLLVAICMYYHTGMEIRMLDGGVDDPLVVTPVYIWMMLVAELLVCAVHPFPGDININTSNIDGILSVLMIFRLYIVGQFIVVHSRILTDSSSQNIGAVSKVKITPFFVFKSTMNNYPGVVIASIMLAMYVVSVWGMRTCEMYYGEINGVSSLLSAMWLSAVTFLTVGYGDLIPSSNCGRFIAVLTGLMGLGSTALLMAVLAKRLEPTTSERYVYNFMTMLHLENSRKRAAAEVVAFVIQLWMRKTKGNVSNCSYTILKWRLRNAVRKMRLARQSSAEIDGASINLIEISHMMSKITTVIDSIMATQNDINHRLYLMERHLSMLQKCFEHKSKGEL